MGESIVAQLGAPAGTRHQLPLPAILALGALALVVRLALLPYESEDASTFLLPWLQEFRVKGAGALGGDFSNYNFPYLLLMYMASLLPLEPLVAIKIMSLSGDILLAFSMAALTREVRLSGLASTTMACITLFAPTVLLNAAMWGQCDSFYTAFLLLSLRGLLRDDRRSAWLFWGVALAFKLQSVFFLPALAAVSVRNRYSLKGPVLAAVTWLTLSLPPIFFGRPWDSTLGIYVQQTQDTRLVSGAANVFAWLPEVSAPQGRWWGIALCTAAIMLVANSYWRGDDTSERRLLLSVAMVAVCPLLLPQMHDRYFFAAEVMSLLFLRRRKLRVVPWLFAFTGLSVYLLYFGRSQYAWPLMIAFIIQVSAVIVLYRVLAKGHTSTPAKVSR